MLVIVCGLQGTGKTTIARKIAEKTGSAQLRTDDIREELIKKPKYTEEEKQSVYNEMLSRTQGLLQRNKNVVLDATFVREENRLQAGKIAELANTNFIVVEVVCCEDAIRGRIKRRFVDEGGAQFGIYQEYKKSFEPISEKHIVIDNSGNLKDVSEQINKYF